MSTTNKQFPVLLDYHTRQNNPDCPVSVPWDALDEEWAMRMHRQTLERLAERSGLCPQEIVVNIERRETFGNITLEDAIGIIQKL